MILFLLVDESVGLLIIFNTACIHLLDADILYSRPNEGGRAVKLRRTFVYRSDCIPAFRRKNPTPTRKKTSGIRKHWVRLKRFVVVRLARLADQLTILRQQVDRLSVNVSALQERVNALAPGQGGGGGGGGGIVSFLRARVGTLVTLETPAGTLFGTIIFVGVDFVQLQEADGSIVLIPLRNVLSVV